MEIWLFILGLVALAIAAMVLVDRRRGSSGASRADDLPGTTRNRPGPMDSPHSGGTGGDGGGAG